MSLSFGGSGLVSKLKMPEHSQVVLGGLGFRLYFYISGLCLFILAIRHIHDRLDLWILLESCRDGRAS